MAAHLFQTWQGRSVALPVDENAGLVGGIGDNNNAGAAWVYVLDSNDNWSHHGSKLVGSGAGSVNLYVTNSTHLVMDIDGYFAPAETSTLQYPLTPYRVVDTRKADGPLRGPYLQSGVGRDFPVLPIQDGCREVSR